MGGLSMFEFVVAAAAGLAVGGGLMILGIAKWGRKFFMGEPGPQGIPGERGPTTCPFASEHPRLLEFMGESLKDRKDLRNFLEGINGKVNTMSLNVSEMQGKLTLLLQGARVRWNGAVPPEEQRG